MNYKNIEDNQFVGRMLESIRRSRDFTQVKVAIELGIPQGTLSKVESGQLELSARLWHRFCLFMQVPLDTIVKGYLDEGKQVPIPKGLEINKKRYRLLSKYHEFCYWNVRGVIPFVQYERSLGSKGSFLTGINRSKIPSSYFLSFDNLVNLSMLEDITTAHQDKASQFLKYFEQEFKTNEFHGDFHDDYKKSKSPFNAIRKFIGHSNKYTCDYQRILLKETDEQITLCYKKKAKQTLDDYFGNYNRFFLENICLYGTESPRNIKVEKRIENENELYDIKVA